MTKNEPELNKIPNNIKYEICGISTLIFLLFFLGIINPFGLNDTLQKTIEYFFGLSFNNLDYLAVSSIPIFGMIFNSKRNEFKIVELINVSLTIVLCVLITIVTRLYILAFIGKPTNPLIPQYLITKPFYLYSTFTIGILMSFLLIKRTEKQNEIDE